MIWNLDPAWLLMAVAFVMVLALFFGAALDAIMREDGFGPIGNMVLFTLGFFGAILLVNYAGINLKDLKLAMGAGLAGAFVSIALLAGIKAGIARWG
ncbi:MAG: hypothetical protein JNL61_11690 [Rhizobiaceae bacterium]|nr:hypothetical protein [Rhizobiaceae bacterium]